MGYIRDCSLFDAQHEDLREDHFEVEIFGRQSCARESSRDSANQRPADDVLPDSIKQRSSGTVVVQLAG